MSKSGYKLGKNTKENLESIMKSGRPASVVLVYAVSDFINYTPVDFCILKTGGLRATSMQQAVFRAGNSKCDGVEKRSKHQDGLAVDLVPWVNGAPSWESKYTFYLSGAFMSYCLVRGLPISSGADWDGDGNLRDGWDPCHMQIKDIFGGFYERWRNSGF